MTKYMSSPNLFSWQTMLPRLRCTTETDLHSCGITSLPSPRKMGNSWSSLPYKKKEISVANDGGSSDKICRVAPDDQSTATKAMEPRSE